MKNILIIFFLLLCFNVVAQQRFPTGPPTQFSTGYFKQGYHQSDSGTIIANRDTNWLAKYSGTVVFKPSNKTFYWFDSTNLTWNAFATAIDTTSLSNRINLKQNLLSNTTASGDTLFIGSSIKRIQNDYGLTFSTNATKILMFIDTLGSNHVVTTSQLKDTAAAIRSAIGSGGLTSVGLSMPSAFSVSGSPLTSNGTINVSGAGTTAQYIRGNGTLATADTGMIPNFYLKVRSLFSGIAPITFNSITGAIGIVNANASGTKGAATFSTAFSDNGLGTIDLPDLVSIGSCTNCNISFDAKGRATAYANGVGPSGAAVDTIFRTPGIDSIYFTINSVQYAIKDSSGISGLNLNNVGSGFRWLATPSGNFKTAFGSNTIILDSSSNSNALTFKSDTSVLATQFDLSLVNNGLSRRGDTTQLGALNSSGSPLNHNTWINTGAFKLTVQGATATSGNVLEGINTGSGTGVYGSSINEYGVLGNSDNLYAVYGVSGTSNAIRGWTTNGNTAAYFEQTASSTNTVTPTLQIKRTTSGTAAAGIGSSIEWYIEKDNGANNTQSHTLRSILTTATSGAEVGQFELYGVNNATLARKFAITGAGQWVWDGYPALTAQIDSTTYKPVAIDASGNVVKMAAWIGSGGGSVTLNNIGAGFRWLGTPGGNFKSVVSSNTIVWDSASNSNALTAKADTSVLATQYDLTQIPTPSWQQTLNVSRNSYGRLIFDTSMTKPASPASPAEHVWMTFMPLVKADDTVTSPFFFNQFSGLNNGQVNEVMMFGWNLSPGGGIVQSNKPALGESWESNYRAEPSPGVFHRFMEKHEYYVTKSAVQYRLGSYTIDTDAGTCNYYHSVDNFSLRNFGPAGTNTPYFTVQGVSNMTEVSLVNNSDQTEEFRHSTNFNQDANTANYTIDANSGKPINLFNISNFRLASLPNLSLGIAGYDGSQISFSGATTGALGGISFDSAKTNFTNAINVPQNFTIDGVMNTGLYKTKTRMSVPLAINNPTFSATPFAALESSCNSTSLEAAGWFQQTGTNGTKYGLEVYASGASGTNEAIYVSAANASTNRAIRIQNPSAGASNWAIFSDATAQSYFAGKIGIGSGNTNPDSILHVIGGIHNSGGGVRFENLPAGTGTKAVRIDASGKLSMADTTMGGGITTLNTLTATTQTFATGTSGSDFNISSASSTHTFNIPSASTSNRGLVTTSSQTFGGEKTFNDGVIVTNPTASSATSLTVSGNRSLAAAPGIAGIGMALSSFTYTNSSGAGTETNGQNFHLIGSPTLTSSNAISYTGDVSTVRFVGAPVAAGSTTISHPWNIFANDVNYFAAVAYALNEQGGDATLGSASHQIYTGGGGNTFTLPSLATHPGKVYFIKNIGGGNLTVARSGSDNIYNTSSVTSITVAAGSAVIIVATSNYWVVE